MIIEMLQTVADFAKGEQYEMDDETAGKYIELGLAQAVDTEAEEAKTYSKFEKALADREQKLFDMLSKELSKPVNVKVPAVAKSEDDNDPRYNFWVALGKTASKNHEVREKGYDILRNKYWRGKAMNETTNADGGYLVPAPFANELLSVEGFDGAIYPNGLKKRTMGKTLTLPALDQTVTPANGSSAFYAGVTIGIVAEGVAPAEHTGFKSKQVVLTAKKGMATSEITSELLSDSPISVQETLYDSFGKASGSWIDWMALRGDGSSTQWTGILDHDSTIKVARKTADDITLEDCAKMYSRLAPGSRKRAKWFITPTAIAKFPLFGTSSHLAWLPNGANGELILKLFGLEIVQTEVLPVVGEAGDVILADTSAIAFGMAKEISVDVSEHVGFTRDVLTYRLIFRGDLKPQLTAPITLANGVDTVSTFVQLDDPAS